MAAICEGVIKTWLADFQKTLAELLCYSCLLMPEDAEMDMGNINCG